jgi:hypothetical protein
LANKGLSFVQQGERFVVPLKQPQSARLAELGYGRLVFA